LPAEDEHLVGREPKGEPFGRGIGGVFDTGVGFEEIAGKEGIRETVNPAIESDAFEEECALIIDSEAWVDGGSEFRKRRSHGNV
jgi:hypothetical protein